MLHVRELHQLMPHAPPGAQVGDYTLAELQALAWPSGDRVITVEHAVNMTTRQVACVTLVRVW